ncbi:DUF3919 family protein [Clostridium sp. B9]|uniref:DUF3919 family protein n=1 Tax=Clostridium sp. B9 TaxID=3423224 RepID=UPI003D2EFC44
MIKNFKNTLIIYLFFVVLIFIAYMHYSKSLYNNLTVIKSPQENKVELNIKIPDKITLTNKYLGTTSILNKSELNELLHYFNKISSDHNTKDNSLPLENTFSISGEIYYLNGEKTSFEISNNLKINDKSYSNDSYLINILRNNLKDAFYTVNNLTSLLASSDSLIKFRQDGELKILSPESKTLLIESFKKLRIMKDNKDFLKTDLSEPPKNHLVMYRYADLGGISNNTFYIDVYDDYVIIQYLGDENGKNIYLKGDLNEEIFK